MSAVKEKKHTYCLNKQQNDFPMIYKVFHKRLHNISRALHLRVKASVNGWESTNFKNITNHSTQISF